MDRLAPYLQVIMNDRIERIGIRKGISFQQLDPELYEEYKQASASGDLIIMDTFLQKLDAKYSEILYIKS